jgi:hypothetical protein
LLPPYGIAGQLRLAEIVTTKTRLESLPKKDRDEVLRVKSLMDERAPDPRQRVIESLASLKRQLARPGSLRSSSLLASQLHFLKSDFSDYGIIQRLVSDDPSHQAIGFRTSGRLGYLMNLAGGPEHSGGYDCAHIFDIFSSIASQDGFATSRFIERFPGPFKSGHQSTVLLANALYCVLAGDHEGFDALAENLRTRKESRFFRAMYDCLLGIMADDTDRVCRAMDEILKWNRRQEQLNSSMQKLVCIPAHALYNLCLVNFARSGKTPPPLPKVDTWDSEFHSFVHKANHDSNQQCFEFSEINPILSYWVNDLPLAVELGALVDTIN